MTAFPAGWAEFLCALGVFLASHIVPARPAIRRTLRAWLGGGAYTIVYSLVSLGLFAWLIVAAGRAPHLQLWDFAPWQLWAPNLVMPLACLLVAFGIAAKSPFSLGAREDTGFDPHRPGIAGITRHPLLWAVTLWAAAHTVPNGDLAHVILFGLFALFGLAGMAALDARKRREWGPELWEKRTAHTSVIPFAAAFTGRFSAAGLRADPVRLLAALAIYLALLFLHPIVIGVSPLPALQG
ncbi:MAG: NnrU family protein [Rhodomicrobium sp.]